MSLSFSSQNLQATPTTTTNLIKSFKDLDRVTIRLSNAYYAKYEESWSLEYLAWSGNYILNTCDDLLRDKVGGRLVSVSEMENIGPLVLKKMHEIFINVDD